MRVQRNSEFTRHYTEISVSAVPGFSQCGAVRYKVLVIAVFVMILF